MCKRPCNSNSICYALPRNISLLVPSVTGAREEGKKQTWVCSLQLDLVHHMRSVLDTLIIIRLDGPISQVVVYPDKRLVDPLDSIITAEDAVLMLYD